MIFFFSRTKILALYITIICMFIGCENVESNKVVNLGQFEIEVPKSWALKEGVGIDFSVNYFLTENNDSIHINYNSSTSFLNEYVQVFSEKQIQKYDSLGLDTSSLVFSKTPKLDESQGVFLKEYYYYDTISGLQAKVKVPKIFGQGVLGISIDSVNKRNESLIIHGTNVSSETQGEFLKSIKSIKITKR